MQARVILEHNKEGLHTSTTHDDSTETQALNLQTNSLLHVMILHYVYLVWNIQLQEWLCKLSALGSSESVKVLFSLLL